MPYADSDFFLALLEPTDWLKRGAQRLLKQFEGNIWTSPTVLTELLLIAYKLPLDPERMMINVMNLAEIRHGDPLTLITAATYMKEFKATPFDAIHAATCGRSDSIISSDKIYDHWCQVFIL